MSTTGLAVTAELVTRAQRGIEGGLEELASAVYPDVRRWTLVLVGDEAEADDLTQEVLIRMIRRLDSYRGEAAFTTWLYSITRRAAIDRGRQRGRVARLHEDPRAVESVVPAGAPAPDGEVERRELGAMIRTFFEELPERQRTVFDLVELQGRTAAEAGALLGIEPVSVRANLFKARRRLRARLLDTAPEIAEEEVR